MSYLTRILVLFVVVIALVTGVSTITAQQASQDPTCPQLVTTAFQVVDTICSGAINNEACYGHAQLKAVPQPHIQSLIFDQAGDIANIADLQTLRLSPMDLQNSLWGVGMLRLRTNVPNLNARRSASILLFGDVTVENTVQTPSAVRTLTVDTADKIVPRVRVSPPYGMVMGLLTEGETVTATGRLADSSWVRIELPDSGRSAWMDAAAFAEQDAIAELDVVTGESAQYGPMQAFTFVSGQNDALCTEAPDSGLVIQTPEGEAEVTFLINEVDIQLGSTVYLKAMPDENMAVYLLEGSSQVSAQGATSTLTPGTMVTIALDANGLAAGPPSAPVPYPPEDLHGFPGQYLDRAFTVVSNDDGTVTVQLDDDPSTTGGGTTGASPNPGGGGDGTTPPVVPGPITGETEEEGEHKITICHDGNTISIDESAWPAHERQGDTLGECPPPEEEEVNPGGESIPPEEPPGKPPKPTKPPK